MDVETHAATLPDNKRENYNVPGSALTGRDDLSLAIERESLNSKKRLVQIASVTSPTGI